MNATANFYPLLRLIPPSFDVFYSLPMDPRATADLFEKVAPAAHAE